MVGYTSHGYSLRIQPIGRIRATFVRSPDNKITRTALYRMYSLTVPADTWAVPASELADYVAKTIRGTKASNENGDLVIHGIARKKGLRHLSNL